MFLEVGNDLSVMQPHLLLVCSRPLATVACQAEFGAWSLSVRRSVHPRTSLTLANVGFLLFFPFLDLLSQVLGMRLRKIIPSRFRDVFFLFFPEKYTPNHGFPEPNLQKPFPSLWGFATYR